MHDVIDRIEKKATPGTVIPKPKACGDYVVKRWGKRRGERALIYTIPNQTHPQPNQAHPHEKGVNESEWIEAFDQLTTTGEFTRLWFETAMADCNKEGGCNFTTIGGIFELLGDAYHERGVYRKT